MCLLALLCAVQLLCNELRKACAARHFPGAASPVAMYCALIRFTYSTAASSSCFRFWRDHLWWQHQAVQAADIAVSVTQPTSTRHKAGRQPLT